MMSAPRLESLLVRESGFYYLCSMPLTTEETRFVEWWEGERDRQRRKVFQLWIGLPLGLLFSLPIVLNFLAGRFWYRRADAVGVSQFNPLVLLVAVVLIAGFTGFFYRRFRWEENEQRYRSFLAKRDSDPGTGTGNHGGVS
jgi:hypothetical protein